VFVILNVAVILAGFFVAGYCGLFEVAIEAALVSWTAIKVFWKPIDKNSSAGWLSWAIDFKTRLIQRAVEGRTFSAAAVVTLIGVAAGWILMLGWLFVRDWRFVVARELKETVVDAVVFVPFVLLLGGVLKQARDAAVAAQDEVEAAHTGEPVATDPRDPDYWDMMGQYGRAMGEVGLHMTQALHGKVAAGASLLALFGLLFAFGGGAYLAGRWTAPHPKLDWLTAFAGWSF
jgi:hypothetical protein